MSEELLRKITDSICDPEEEEAVDLAKQALEEGIAPLSIVEALTKGINILGDRFEALECFLPELIIGANAMEEAMKVLTPEIEKLKGDATTVPVKIVVGNLQGDIHDIGREILCTMCRVAGFNVTNLGHDVKPDTFIDKAIEADADLIGLSSLLTTSLPFAKEMLSLLDARGLRGRFKVMMGGGAVTAEYVKKIGADNYALTATEAVSTIKSMFEGR